MRKMMNHFTKLSKELDVKGSADVEMRMLFVLSIIAELMRAEPKFFFPFTRKFLLNVFSIDNELLEKCNYCSKILAILAVIYQNLSNQGRLMKKLNVEAELKRALLGNFSLITELFTLKLFNRSILNINARGIPFTSADLSKYRVLETISKFIEANKMEVFLIKIKSVLLEKKQ